MCFSATVSYAAAGVLVSTGLYTLKQTRGLSKPYWLLALTPLLFGLQQGFEGRVWQEVDIGRADLAVPYALGFHFFSHFLWLWWFPLCSALLEPGRVRKRVFAGIGVFGAIAGSLVYFTLVAHPEWMTVEVEQYSIVYDISTPYRGPFRIPIPASALYALIVLVPLLFSSHKNVRTFGGLIAVSMVLASLAYGYAFVSVWCLFAALLSAYIGHIIHQSRLAFNRTGV